MIQGLKLEIELGIKNLEIGQDTHIIINALRVGHLLKWKLNSSLELKSLLVKNIMVLNFYTYLEKVINYSPP